MAVQGVSGTAVAAAAAGVLLIWSGLKGAKVTTAARQLAGGKQPTGGALPVTSPAAAAEGSAPAAGEGSLGGVFSLSGPGRTNWAKSFLSALGAPLTTANINSIVGWQNHEGGGGQNNPLNTTLDAPGATDFNSVGVKNYPSASEGLSATVATINGGPYGDILMALHSGQGLCGRSFAGLSTWSNGGYSSVC